jgi:hypothetical protein
MRRQSTDLTVFALFHKNKTLTGQLDWRKKVRTDFDRARKKLPALKSLKGRI